MFSAPASVLFEARGIAKRFGAVRALDGVDLTVASGEIHALMGENGAGKSTLIKCITGVERRDQGTIAIAGRSIDPKSPREAEALGISTVYQEVNLIPHLSVAENICLRREPVRRFFRTIRWNAVRERARRALARLDLSLDVDRELGACSIAVQQLVAIARALDVDARLLVLDEPTSSLDRNEVARLFGVMRRLREEGLGFVFVTHYLDQVYAIADRITVLRDGRLAGCSATSDLPRQRLVSLMVGREFTAPLSPARAAVQAKAPFVEARGMARNGAIEPIDLAIAAGESVGLVGLLGSGRTEVAQLLFGVDRISDGALMVDGRRVRFTCPADAIARGFAMTPENRKADGIVPHLSVRENIALALQARRGIWSRIPSAELSRLVETWSAALAIRTASEHTPVEQLSGGNQQRVLLARWLAMTPRFLILDEPTRGIDVGAKAEILRIVEELRLRGVAILFVSSEVEETVRVCERLVVLRDRRKVCELSGSDCNEEAALAAIAQHDG